MPRRTKPGPDHPLEPVGAARQYEQLRRAAVHGGHRHGLAVLLNRGLAAFLALATALAPVAERVAQPSPPQAGLASGLEQEIVRIWAQMVLANPP
jgi:hypothetical protein